MHELSIAYQIIRSVDNIKAEQGFTEVESITLQLGEMSGVVPRFLEEAWKNIETDMRLEIETVSAKARCRNCGYTDLVRSLGMECPQCGSPDFEIISGREFLIKEIKAK